MTDEEYERQKQYSDVFARDADVACLPILVLLFLGIFSLSLPVWVFAYFFDKPSSDIVGWIKFSSICCVLFILLRSYLWKKTRDYWSK